jgi:flagellar motor switch protein FliN/FliY
MADKDDEMSLPDLTETDALPAVAPGAEEEEDTPEHRTAHDLEAVFDVPVNVSAVLGKTELDRKVGEAIDIYVNDRLVARGEVVLVEDRLGVTMTEIIKGGLA